MAAALNIVAISGSLRKASTNSGLLRYAQSVVPSGVTVTIVDISHLPMFNQDLETPTNPAIVDAFRDEIKKADGFFFACPENNYSVSACLKNAIDWGSRKTNLWAKKPAAVVGAGGGAGTLRGQMALRQIAHFIDMNIMLKPEVYIKAFEPPKKFDENGDLIDNDTKDRVKALVLAFVDYSQKWNAAGLNKL